MILLLFGITSCDGADERFTYQEKLARITAARQRHLRSAPALFDSASGGLQVGCRCKRITNVPANGGVFTVTSIWSAAFSGAARFLEISMRPSGVGNCHPAGAVRQLPDALCGAQPQRDECRHRHERRHRHRAFRARWPAALAQTNMCVLIPRPPTVSNSNIMPRTRPISRRPVTSTSAETARQVECFRGMF